MAIKLLEITKCVTSDSANIILSELSKKSNIDNIVDIAGCSLFNGANAVLEDIIKEGFEIIDSDNKFNNDILKFNRNIHQINLSQTAYADKYPINKDEILNIIKGLEDEIIYSCRTEGDFPVVLLSQILKPAIMWYVPDLLFTDFINYSFNMLYRKNGKIELNHFLEIMKQEEKADILANNTLYTIELPKKFTGKEVFNFFSNSYNYTWIDIFYRIKILPFSLGRYKHLPKSNNDVYFYVVNNIIASIKRKRKKLLDLEKFINAE